MSVPENTSMDEIRPFLRATRQAAGLSRAELAKRCGVKENTIRLLESRNGSFSGRTLMAVCGELGVRLEPKKVRQ